MVRLFLCGDVMTGRGIDQILRQPSDPRLHEQYVKGARDYVALAEEASGPIPKAVAPDYIWGDALEVWRGRKPDLKIGNLETAITASEKFAPKGINYRMHPDNAGVLSAAAFDCLSLANNHVLDWGAGGLRDTIAALDRIGIRHAGAGATQQDAQAPAMLESPGGRLLVFALGSSTSGIPLDWAAGRHLTPGPSPASQERGARKQESLAGIWLLNRLDYNAVASVRDAVTSHRQPGDTVIISLHWGSNWGYEVPDAQVRFAHALIDECGADIVHGHSSHHPRRTEIHNGHPIFYGCGDFINDYEGIAGYEEFRGDLALMYFVEFDPAPFTLRKLELVPLQIHRFRLRRAAAEDARWLLGSLNAASEPFGTRFELAQKDMIKVNL